MTGSPRVVPTVRQTERDWSRTVIDYAKLRGWDLRYHTQHSLGSDAGFPDWLLVRDRVVFVELKGDGGKLSPHQTRWVEGLRAAGAEVHVWWPSDWDDVVRALT
jgi:hypothetical protein